MTRIPFLFVTVGAFCFCALANACVVHDDVHDPNYVGPHRDPHYVDPHAGDPRGGDPHYDPHGQPPPEHR